MTLTDALIAIFSTIIGVLLSVIFAITRSQLANIERKLNSLDAHLKGPAEVTKSGRTNLSSPWAMIPGYSTC